MKRILCLVSLAAWLSFGHAKLTAGGEGRVRILANECVFFSIFFPSYRFSIFSRSNAHTRTNKEGAKTHGKAERRQGVVRFTRQGYGRWDLIITAVINGPEKSCSLRLAPKEGAAKTRPCFSV